MHDLHFSHSQVAILIASAREAYMAIAGARKTHIAIACARKAYTAESLNCR